METSYGVSLRVFANSFAFSLISFLQIVEQSILSKSVWQASKSESIAEYSCLMFQGSSFVVFILYSIVASNCSWLFIQYANLCQQFQTKSRELQKSFKGKVLRIISIASI